jgi:hypothetical protein
MCVSRHGVVICCTGCEDEDDVRKFRGSRCPNAPAQHATLGSGITLQNSTCLRILVGMVVSIFDQRGKRGISSLYVHRKKRASTSSFDPKHLANASMLLTFYFIRVNHKSS